MYIELVVMQWVDNMNRAGQDATAYKLGKYLNTSKWLSSRKLNNLRDEGYLKMTVKPHRANVRKCVYILTDAGEAALIQTPVTYQPQFSF